MATYIYLKFSTWLQCAGTVGEWQRKGRCGTGGRAGEPSTHLISSATHVGRELKTICFKSSLLFIMAANRLVSGTICNLGLYTLLSNFPTGTRTIAQPVLTARWFPCCAKWWTDQHWDGAVMLGYLGGPKAIIHLCPGGEKLQGE